MRILLIVHSVAWKGGGAFFHALHIAKGLVEFGHCVDVMATSQNSILKVKKNQIDSVQLLEFPDLLIGQARNGWDLYNTFRRIFFLLSNSYDVVHLLDTRPVVIFPGLFSKYIKKSKLIIEWLDWFGKGGTATERNKYLRFFMVPIESFFEEKFRKFADGSIGLGSPLTERIKKYAPVSPYITITHGCDTRSIIKINRNKARQELGLKMDAYYLGYTGRMREDVIIRLSSIIKYLIKKIDQKNIYCLLIGNPAFNYGHFVEDNIKQNFISTGWVEYIEINKYMCAADILILPFDSESIARNGIWPSKFNDYLSVGRPIISTKLKVLEKIFAEEKIGFMVEDEIEKISKKIIYLFKQAEIADMYGENARKLAETKYNWENIINQINDFYSRIL